MRAHPLGNTFYFYSTNTSLLLAYVVRMYAYFHVFAGRFGDLTSQTLQYGLPNSDFRDVNHVKQHFVSPLITLRKAQNVRESILSDKMQYTIYSPIVGFKGHNNKSLCRFCLCRNEKLINISKYINQ